MTTSIAYLSFLVRLWREPVPGGPEVESGWRGEVEHIQSGRRWTLQSLEEVLDCLYRQAETATRGHQAQGTSKEE